MFHILRSGAYYDRGKFVPAAEAVGLPAPQEAKKGTISYGILKSHNTTEDMDRLKIKFDAMASHDITYVGIIQTARASGLEQFPLPYVLTNCHNSLCAVGGTINEDDHVFGLSAAKKYGGEFVPAHQAVIHSYMRERYAPIPTPVTALSAPWPSARAVPSWSSSCSIRPTTLPIPRSLPSISPARPGPASALRTWLCCW